MNQEIKLIWLCTFCVLLLTSLDSFAQTRPDYHWTTFNKKANQCACHLFATQALHSEGLKIVEDTGMVILADNNKAVAEVVCLPGDRQIRLSVYSSDSKTAELIRNNVRAKIVKSVLLDNCP